MTYEKISVIGLGYIGLPTAAILATKEMNVVGIDINPKTVDIVNSGGVHIFEPDLEGLVKNVVKAGFLRAATLPEPSDVFLIAVPTPFNLDESSADLGYIKAAIRAISDVIKTGDLVILESTSPVGTTEQVAKWLFDLRPDLVFPEPGGDSPDIHLAYCPERVLPGNAVQELQENDRVIGGLTEKCSSIAKKFYETFVRGECFITNARTAEMAKLTENSFRDVNIAFANELSMICDEWNISVWELIGLANHHPRVNILEPGPGVGGHCISVDPWFIISKALGKARLMRMARDVNDSKPQWVHELILDAVAKYLSANITKSQSDIIVSVYGLAFKPDVDDLRESPSVKIVKNLGENFSGIIQIIEPYITQLPKNLGGRNLKLVEFSEAGNANIHVLLVKHSQFKNLKSTLNPDAVLLNIKGD
jgi:UDP-N-acetyl-D-mannosaminuronic acid dehydrogenase